ncbi:hypothetical protein BRADI_3g52065v3 [Brachypodium distachyon]|uniref:Uncharacterized protein n=1 Tax=Brachypodium distachyon TaxID=15368 RepID=A0A2K2D4Q1_BRADI|nr:hypothetical protein BRADI_3g52065v3 [Brachypodium distachyon]
MPTHISLRPLTRLYHRRGFKDAHALIHGPHEQMSISGNYERARRLKVSIQCLVSQINPLRHTANGACTIHRTPSRKWL